MVFVSATSIQMHNLGRWASERSLYLSEIQDNEPKPEITTLVTF